MKQINEEMKKLRGKDDPATIDQKQALMKKLEKLQEGMPEPLPALHSVANMTEKKSPIHLLSRGDYQAKGYHVGMRPL